MGLSGRKTKQRIPNDPRNLAWANDASKFGAAYLAKLGWDPTRGLGVSGEGRTTALSVTQKLDMLGIGADHRNNADGIAWKQNKDFENLLRRLNAANGNGEREEPEPMKIDGFVRAGPVSTNEGGDEAQSADVEETVVDIEESGEKKSKKKRKKRAEEDGGEGEGRTKKRKKSKSSDDFSDAEETSNKEKKKKKKKQDATEETASAPAETSVPTLVSAPVSRASSKHPRAAFRGRHMAAKSLASKSASALAEILGISPTPSASASGYPSSAPTPYPSTPCEPGPSTSSSSGSATPAEEIQLQELTVSNKSVMDYFKEKLAAKSNARVFASASSTSAPGTHAADEDYAERPRMGLGASKLRTEIARAMDTETVEVEERRGLGGIGNGMRASFAAMFTSATITSTSVVSEAESAVPADGATAVQDEEVDGEVPTSKKSKKEKERKKEKNSKKEKGKEKAAAEEADATCVDAVQETVDEKAERKRRKEEKRRRKEAETEASAAARALEDGDDASDAELKEKKRKKDKKKNKAER